MRRSKPRKSSTVLSAMNVSDDVLALNPILVRAQRPDPPAPKANKFKAERTEIDGKTFDSRKEARRYLYLKSLKAKGLIRSLILQPSFLLQEAFIDSEGQRHRAIIYRADFKYFDVAEQHWIVEDVKSLPTAKLQAFRDKWKMLLYLHRHDRSTRFALVFDC